jgi:hypothetical protein
MTTKRKGPGRPMGSGRIPKDKQRVTKNLSLDPKTVAWLESEMVRLDQTNLGRALDEMCREVTR